MKKAISLLALVCALAPLVFSTAYAQANQWRFRAGLRNSPGSQRLSAAQLQLVLDSLRHKTGFLEMRFDEAGFLTLGDRTRCAGGSAIARELLIAAVDGQQAFELEAYDHSPDVAFARLTGGNIYISAQTNVRIKARQVQLDFADFAQLIGNREALAAFDIGIAVLHEMVHGVLHLHDAVGDTTQLGECDEHINRMRRELELPERQHYSPRLRMIGLGGADATNALAELLFVRAGGESGRAKAEKFYVRWWVEKVGSAAEAVSHPRERTAKVAAAQ